ncbi:MAG: U32 family peptidase, partial [Clostridium sp.]
MSEILSPAGNPECLRAAVLNGADAVYIGGSEFSARKYASNFSREEIIEAVRYCHSYNVKLYVTINTVLDNNELIEALDYASFLYQIGIDAVIVQDIGFLKLLRQHLPALEVHASTQMTVHNLYGVNLLYNMGVKRVVLARELSIKEIKYIKDNTKAELEVFVHGALCVCFSGQCLFSSMIGGRSGNRGTCAQSCRMEYSLDSGEKTHLLSPKDLSTLEYIKSLVDIGVDSLKIEGRMKRFEYVAVVVASYKKAISGMLEEQDIKNVTQVFNRGGFTSAFMKNNQGKDMMSYERPKNWGTYLGVVIANKGRFCDIRLEEELRIEDGVEIFGKDKGVKVSSMRKGNQEVEYAVGGEAVTIYLEGTAVGDKIYKSSDARLLKAAKDTLEIKTSPKRGVKAEFVARIGEGPVLTIKVDSGNVYKDGKIFRESKENIKEVEVRVISEKSEKAINKPTTKEKVEES